MRWTLIILLMCNGIYFLWQNYLLQDESVAVRSKAVMSVAPEKSLQLLAEAPQPELQREQAVPLEKTAVLPKEEDRPISNVQKICWLIGPFNELVSGKQVVGRLSALDIKSELAGINIVGEPDYSVYLPPRLSRKAALKFLKELQAKKIDSFLITKGELANGISLGFFSQLDRAKALLKQRIKQGYSEARIKEVPRERTELWAVFNSEEYGKFSEILWENVKQGNKGLERRKNYCDKIASASNFD